MVHYSHRKHDGSLSVEGITTTTTMLWRERNFYGFNLPSGFRPRGVEFVSFVSLVLTVTLFKESYMFLSLRWLTRNFPSTPEGSSVVNIWRGTFPSYFSVQPDPHSFPILLCLFRQDPLPVSYTFTISTLSLTLKFFIGSMVDSSSERGPHQIFGRCILSGSHEQLCSKDSNLE